MTRLLRLTTGGALFGLTTPDASDAAFYYLVSIRNGCGEGPLGADSSGQPLPNNSPCP